MDIDLIFKIAAIGIIVAVLNQLLIRSGREDQAMMTTLAGWWWCCPSWSSRSVFFSSPSSPSLRYERPHDAGTCGDGGCAVHPVPEKRPGFRAVRLDGNRCPCAVENQHGGADRAFRADKTGTAGRRRRLFLSAAVYRCHPAGRLRPLALRRGGAESLAWCTALAGRVLVLAAAWPLLEEIGQKIGSIAG